MQLKLIATCAFGLEAVVSRELTQLGYEPRGVRSGRIAFDGDASAVCRANLWLRSADRVLIELAAFEAADFDALFETTRALPWEEWIASDAAMPVRGRSLKSQLSSVPAIQRSVKKAIVERMLSAGGATALPETGPPVPVEISIVNNLATLDIDTSGDGLHGRGYRTLAAAAQLRETLAAALVQLSFWQPDRQLVDPFCGTGTIAIEAALIGRRLAPGRNRTFAAAQWPGFAADAWKTARQEVIDLALPDLPLRIIGCDADAESLKLARYHAGLAGVADDIHFQQHEFSDLTSSRNYGCVVTNPPYGVRMGEEEEIERLYRTMPDVLRRLKTWSHFILTARPDFEQLVGQRADRRRKLFNGRLECTLFQFFGPKPPKRKREEIKPDENSIGSAPSPLRGGLGRGAEAIAAPAPPHTPPLTPPPQGEGDGGNRAIRRPAFGGLLPESSRQAEEFANRLRKLARHLRRWPAKRGITCYRIYERDIPEIPLVVDRYENALHIAEFDRPHERTAAEHADWLDLMVRTAGEALETPPELVFLKHRQRQRGDAQYERVADRGAVRVVNEGGLRFQVNLSDYLDTGLFLDHRITREMVRDAAAGTRLLNLFAYTGSFTVYAAAGGAAETVTVDMSPTYLQWAEENLRLNGLGGPTHLFVRSDAGGFLKSLRGKPPFDLAVVDPPTFSNSKRLEYDWDVQRDHAALLQQVLAHMRPGGVVFFSTNSRRFKLDDHAAAGAMAREITKQTIPEDFRNKKIHRCWRIVKGEE